MGNLGDVWWWRAWRWRSPWLGRWNGCLGDGGSLHGLRSPRQAVCRLLTGVLWALQRRFPRPSGMTICLARRTTATPRVCHRRPPPAGAFTSSCPGRGRVPRHAAARAGRRARVRPPGPSAASAAGTPPPGVTLRAATSGRSQSLGHTRPGRGDTPPLAPGVRCESTPGSWEMLSIVVHTRSQR